MFNLGFGGQPGMPIRPAQQGTQIGFPEQQGSQLGFPGQFGGGFIEGPGSMSTGDQGIVYAANVYRRPRKDDSQRRNWSNGKY